MCSTPIRHHPGLATSLQEVMGTAGAGVEYETQEFMLGLKQI